MKNWNVKLAGVFLVLATAWYLPWAFGHLNHGALWLSIPFAAASLMMAVTALVTTLNHWHYRVPEERLVPVGNEPQVVVVIPTYGEPPAMVYATAKSVLEQDYAQDKIALVVTDDGHDQRVRAVVERLDREHPKAHLNYHKPPLKGDPLRRGDGKAGNLNAVLDALDRYAPDATFVETRDADDVVGDPSFLRQTIAQLEADRKVAFVQTIKEAKVSPGDPFGNLEPLFYRRAMLAKHAHNAVFPCGSGLVWRLEALHDIGGFPTWNLVEDLQSGVEALRRGWRGGYLPIVGAVGQTAPEDIPNTIKQRGTWALDTMRLTFWGNRRGLTLRQNLQFSELGLFYLLSFAMLAFAITPIFTLAFDTYPVVAAPADFALHFWPFAAAVELLLVCLAKGLPFESLWRARQTWLGMAPVYAKAAVLALFYGRNRKPAYSVTRKEHQRGIYVRPVLPQFLIFTALILSGVYHVATHTLLRTADLGSLFWAVFFAAGLSRVVRNAWHGVESPIAFPTPPRRIRSLWNNAFDAPKRSVRKRAPGIPRPARHPGAALSDGDSGFSPVPHYFADGPVDRNRLEGR